MGWKENGHVARKEQDGQGGFIMMAKLSALGGYVLFCLVTRGRRQTWGGWCGACCVVDQDEDHMVRYKGTHWYRCAGGPGYLTGVSS